MACLSEVVSEVAVPGRDWAVKNKNMKNREIGLFIFLALGNGKKVCPV
jgi:hypothetical protein